MSEIWPLFDICIEIADISLKPVDDKAAFALGELATKGIHEPKLMPFSTPWSDLESPELEKSVLQNIWKNRASFDKQSWRLDFAVFKDDCPIGIQDIKGDEFNIRRSVSTGSWIGKEFQGQGIGTNARRAILDFAFFGLKANEAHSDAYEDNHASIRVSKKLGYERNGTQTWARRNKPAKSLDWILTRDKWEQSNHERAKIIGLDKCLNWFGTESD
ncbi:MAG: GNAT family N-acetyltransferase [Acidimicrobiales bacterium]|nr:GNAT family N-acetyltransferase [Acidimicrobiales bacterium]